MAKNKGKRHSGPRRMTFPLLAIGGMIPLVKNTYDHYRWFGFNGHDGAVNFATAAVTGFHVDTGTFEPAMMKYGTVPIVVGMLGHTLASRLGINRLLGRMGIPFIRL